MRCRANERDPGVATGASEVGRLGEEAVARVDRVAAGVVGCLDQTVDVEIRRDAQPIERRRLIGRVNMQGLRVVLRVDRHGLNAQVGGCPGDPDGDLPAIGDQQF